jgi:protein-tyrosine phosphatase
MIDLHCHVLAGIDDGPETIEGSVALARLAEARGVETIVATPHVSWHYDNDSGTIATRVADANRAVGAAGLALNVLAGAEIAITRGVELDAAELSALALGDGPWLLVECPFTPVPTGVDMSILELEHRGHRVVLAHPERCPAFQRDPSMLQALVQNGAVTSITAGSLVGRFGSAVRHFALELIDAELVHNVASDAHDAAARQPGMAAELEQAGLGALAEWLTELVPTAILAGRETVPPRPPVTVPLMARAPRRWWRRGPLRRAS